jgi:hypothetical protein
MDPDFYVGHIILFLMAKAEFYSILLFTGLKPRCKISIF